MPQDSVTYGVTRIRCHEKGLLGQDKLQRILDGSAEEAVRQLVDMGYGGLPDATAADAEQMVSNELAAAYALVKEVSFAPAVTNVFLMKADVHNLKLLLKLRLTGSGEAPALMQGGVYAPDALKRMVEAADYRDLPPQFQAVLSAMEQDFQSSVDPARISTALDGAYVQYAYDTKHPLVLSYFKARADFDNVLAMLRLRQTGGSAERLRSMLLPEGAIPHAALLAALDAPMEGIARLVAMGPARAGILRGLDALQKGEGIAVLERERDDYLIKQVGGARFDNDTIAPVVAYLLAREQEAVCIRLVLTAKRNGLPDSIITERLRGLYGW
ncbi:MAG: V-type ATPase subunit [Candidatus Pelethousia sp.]|nr:V-type ATPase subunit [Candidatus Pelethousia sp.]